MSLLAEVQFGREILGNLELAESREWLVTNGLGGFASGTVAGTSTRRYHGLLMASLHPPTDRTLLVAGVDEVGRGSLFGPVVAAAVILDPAYRLRDETLPGRCRYWWCGNSF